MLIDWNREEACVRTPVSPISYIERETYVLGEIDKLLEGTNGDHEKKRPEK